MSTTVIVESDQVGYGVVIRIRRFPVQTSLGELTPT